MAKYITPGKLLTMELGSDFDALDDVKLESLCAQASALVDAYCLVPRLPQSHDLKGGVVSKEIHEWRYPANAFDIGQRRMYVMHRPLISVSSLKIFVSRQPIYIEIAPENLVINPTGGYADIVALALTPSGLFNALVVPNVGIFTPITEMDYTYGWDLSIVGDLLFETDAKTFRAENQFWKTDPAPVIYLNGTEQTTGFTIDYTEGTVEFDDMLTASDVVTADYSYRLPNNVMQAAGHICAFLRSGARMRAKGLDRLSSIAVAEVKLTRAPSVKVEDIDEYIPEAAMLLADFRYDGLVVR